jgi:hypothetical protein
MVKAEFVGEKWACKSLDWKEGLASFMGFVKKKDY